MDLRNGDCLEILKDIPSKSVDLVFADLPYGQVNCKWDCKIDLELLWKELLRIAKSDTTPFFFTCTTKFGYELIKSNEKMFKYDLVWAKSNPCGFLQAKKRPMRKHEMLYVFYKKQPAYDISSHKHKFKKEETTEVVKDDSCDLIYGKNANFGKKHYTSQERSSNVYNPPLPVSVIKEEHNSNPILNSKIYGTKDRKTPLKQFGTQTGNKGYDPPLPTSVIKEDKYNMDDYLVKDCGDKKGGTYGREKKPHKSLSYPQKNGESAYDPALPVSVLKEDDYEPSLPHSLLEIKSIRLKQHSTAKPPDLMKWILKYYTKEGDMVLDPTMGSNPMGLACKEMNRNYIGIEKDPDIYKFACSRVE